MAMFEQITIEGFRQFERFTFQGLGRVNLLVGPNSCGKTSALEAIELLACKGDPQVVWNQLFRRGEWEYDLEYLQRDWSPEVRLRHLFPGHQVVPGGIHFSAAALEADWSLSVGIEPIDPADGMAHPEHQVGEDYLIADWKLPRGRKGKRRIRTTTQAGLTYDRANPRSAETEHHCCFVAASGLATDEIIRQFASIALTEEEEWLVTTLQTIEPSIERLASIATPGVHAAGATVFGARGGDLLVLPSSTGGLLVKCKDRPRIPLGSLGDGIWRLLGIALGLVNAAGGVLLVDEIDAGLHYTVQETMWRLVHDTACRLDVQVFATTHSRDCVESLSAIAGGQDATLQRIEPGRSTAVRYGGDEIIAATRHDIEVR